MSRPAVRHTEEFARIAASPRRLITQADADAYAEILTPEVACAGATVALRPLQAYGIGESVSIWQERGHGTFWGLPVGFGKTLPMFILPRACEFKRPLVIVPGRSLVEKTRDDFASFTGRWKPPNPLPVIITQESLTGKAGETFFETMQPDAIFLEEADEWANPEASHSVRLDRYLANVGFDVAVYALTATPTRKSLLSYAHILRWCLMQDAPVPESHAETRMWAAAIDDYGTREGKVRRPHPGPMGPTVRAARAWWAKRLAETPGVFLIDGDSAGNVPLTITQRLYKECPAIDEAFKMFAQDGAGEYDGEVPDGLVFSDGLSRWRIDTQLQCGYFLRYVAPGPPDGWRAAKRARDEFVRDLIAASQRSGPVLEEREVLKMFATHPAMVEYRECKKARSGVSLIEWLDDYARARSNADALTQRLLAAARRTRTFDTERQVLAAFPEHDTVLAFAEQCAKHGKSFPTEAVWVSTAGVESVVEWFRAQTEPTVIWCGGVEFARALAIALRLPYYGSEGKDERGRSLHKAPTSESMIVSWNANMRGFNLQAWTNHAITQAPQSAKYREQIYGRPHRAGVKGAVRFTEFIGSGGGLDAFDAAMSEASFAKATTGLTQKILRAHIEYATPPRTATNAYRWATREEE